MKVVLKVLFGVVLMDSVRLNFVDGVLDGSNVVDVVLSVGSVWCLLYVVIIWNSGWWFVLCGMLSVLIICLNGMFWCICVLMSVCCVCLISDEKLLCVGMLMLIVSVLMKKLIRLVIFVCLWFVVGMLM